MQFMCLVYFEPGAFDAMSEAESAALTDATIVHDHQLRERGQLVVARPLDDARKAVTVRVRKDKVLRTDGPFIETKEWIGGFLLIEAQDLDEAIAIAAESPIARISIIEVRPIRVQTHSVTGEGRPAAQGG